MQFPWGRCGLSISKASRLFRHAAPTKCCACSERLFPSHRAGFRALGACIPCPAEADQLLQGPCDPDIPRRQHRHHRSPRPALSPGSISRLPHNAADLSIVTARLQMRNVFEITNRSSIRMLHAGSASSWASQAPRSMIQRCIPQDQARRSPAHRTQHALGRSVQRIRCHSPDLPATQTSGSSN